MRYFLDQDNSGHWYLVKSEFRIVWQGWIEKDSKGIGLDIPNYATRINHPNQITFELSS